MSSSTENSPPARPSIMLPSAPQPAAVASSTFPKSPSVSFVSDPFATPESSPAPSIYSIRRPRPKYRSQAEMPSAAGIQREDSSRSNLGPSSHSSSSSQDGSVGLGIDESGDGDRLGGLITASSSRTNLTHQRSISSKTFDREEAYRIMSNHLYKNAESRGWFNPDPSVPSAVAIRLAKHRYLAAHAEGADINPFIQALHGLNPEVALTFTSSLISAITSKIAPEQTELTVSEGKSVQVVDTMAEVASARPAQGACFVRLEETLVLWADRVDVFEGQVEAMEKTLVKFVWDHVNQEDSDSLEFVTSLTGSADASELEKQDSSKLPRRTLFQKLTGSKPAPKEIGAPISEKDAEKEQTSADVREVAPRSVNYYAPCYNGAAFAVNLLIIGLFVEKLVVESVQDGTYLRMALLAAVPFFFAVTSFMTEFMIGVIAQLLLPIGHMSRNSLYYSGLPPVRLTKEQGLPHVTVVIPVYKESLKAVLAPTIESVEEAIRTYELQGGQASIIICEDGLQLVDSKEVALRKDYYDRHNCAWVARHPKGRAGRFKKSSNLNVMKALSLRVEEMMDLRRPTDIDELRHWSAADEDALYKLTFQEALAEHEGRVWGAGNIRIGDYILMLDADTRLPADCFLDACSEMEQCPEVGILQVCSSTFLAGAGYFENGISFFTKCVNFSISWVVANGGCSPFMGHNAFLRWSALQEQAFIDPEDGVRKIWSESHVSEDFVISLNLIRAGYILRWATYFGDGFKEGVSLSAVDELNRWQKYAFGCSEMAFNPIRQWHRKSPFAKLYREFLWSNAPLHYKFSCTSYIFSYWAIACGAPMTLAMYFVQGLFFDYLDPAFFAPFKVLLSLIVIFTAGGGVAMIAARYRSKHASLWTATKEQLTWIPFFVIFFNGLSLHVAAALASHIVGYNMQWSTTVKEVEDSSIFEEFPKVLKRFWGTYIICGTFLVSIILLATPLVPFTFRIVASGIFIPGVIMAAGHILYPLLLNPDITLFRY
ncbi:hypothetical protein MNV49_005442 [Pseudohyphozyma bogoriensis]|nr:hypothetical protein MNV49_005442 [Pseudohyphozyma bogoriensis]